MRLVACAPGRTSSTRGNALNIEFDRAATVGERFKAAREKAKLSIDMVADQSRLSRRYIAAIEQNRFDLIPGDVYVKNFCRIYANHIGMHDDDISQIINSLNNNRHVPIQMNINTLLKKNNRSSIDIRIALSGVILCLILIIFLLNL